MIELGQHPADEVTLFGHTAHGLFSGGGFPVLLVDGQEFPLPQGYWPPSPATLQIVRHPDAGPVPLDDETLEAERAEGRVWQNYALVKAQAFHGSTIYGQPLGGWIHIDSLGRRWVLRLGALPNAVPGQPYTLELDCRPFGYLDGAPMEPVSLSVSCADLQQLTTGERFVYQGMANSTGSRGILALVPVAPANALPSGFLELAVTDDDGELSATLSVLRSQAQVRGAWDTTHPTAALPGELYDTCLLLVSAQLQGAVYPYGPDFPYFPEGGGTATINVTGLSEIPADGQFVDSYLRGVLSASCGRTGRIIALLFDEADQLVEMSFDTRYEYQGDHPGWSGTATGSLSAYGDGVGINANPWTSVDEPAVSVARTISEQVEQTLTIKRNGLSVYSFINRRSYSATVSAGIVPAGLGWAWATGYIGHWISGFINPERVDISSSGTPTAGLAEKGGPWPQSWPTNPTYVSGESVAPYLMAFPLGPGERDVDTLQFSFDTISYDLDGGAESMTLTEVRPAAPGVVPRREMALVFAHAQALARGEGAQYSPAYHPVDHVIAYATDTSQTPSFV